MTNFFWFQIRLKNLVFVLKINYSFLGIFASVNYSLLAAPLVRLVFVFGVCLKTVAVGHVTSRDTLVQF